jgi:hypothetical protein
VWAEQDQKYQTSTFDTLEGGWLTKLPEYRPGRSLMVKTPEAVKWTKSFSSEKRLVS